uniref:Agrin n=1 Tax=Ascaris suum TaxID=6253 RepID=F1KT22_ASCSU
MSIIQYCTVLILSTTISSARSVAFQGSCADQAVLCEQLCIAISNEAYECGCWDGHVLLGDGLGCIANESKVVFEFPGKSTREAPPQIAALGFNGRSFVQFPAPENAYLETNISIEFRFDENHDGIIFYAGEFEGSDFISVAMSGKDIVLRFDCGEGTVEDLYNGPFEKNVWHALSVKRKFCSRSEVKVDAENVMYDDIRELANYKGITIEQGLFVGGTPSKISRLDERTTTSNGFRGCIRKLVVNGIELFHTATAVNLAMSPTEPCQRQELVVKANSSSRKFDAVDVRSQSSNESVALNDAFIFNRSSPLDGFALPFDDPDEAVPNVTTTKRSFAPKVAEFDADAYVKLNAPRDVDEYLELSFHLKPIEPNGLVYLHRSKSRYFAVYLEDAFLSAQYSLGADCVILRSGLPLALNSWHEAEIWRSGRAALIKVDHQSWIENRVSSDVTDFHRTGFSFFGGAPDDQIPSEVQSRRGFSGCLKKVHQNGRAVHLLEDALTSTNVHECGWDPCSETHCGAHARCVDAHAIPVCMCRFPAYGPLCEKVFDSGPSKMKFSHFSYLRFADHRIMRHITGETLDLSFLMKRNKQVNSIETRGISQVLVYVGDEDNVGDFLHLLLTNKGELRLIMNLGSGITTLTHPTRIHPTKWYNVTISRQARQISLSVNGSSITTTAPSPSVEMNVYDAFYIGGTKRRDGTLTGFFGCIQGIRIDYEEIDSPLNVTEAINILRC